MKLFPINYLNKLIDIIKKFKNKFKIPINNLNIAFFYIKKIRLQ